jgi:hypothetical protein
MFSNQDAGSMVVSESDPEYNIPIKELIAQKGDYVFEIMELKKTIAFIIYTISCQRTNLTLSIMIQIRRNIRPG